MFPIFKLLILAVFSAISLEIQALDIEFKLVAPWLIWSKETGEHPSRKVFLIGASLPVLPLASKKEVLQSLATYFGMADSKGIKLYDIQQKINFEAMPDTQVIGDRLILLQKVMIEVPKLF